MQFYYSNCEQNAPNLLVLNVQPNEGFSLCVNGKKSNQNNEMQKVKLPYTMPIKDKMNTVDAYENLLFDCLKGDATNFTHWEELKSTWKFVDAIQDQWTMVEPCFPNYEAGTNGPLESDLLLSRDGNHWWDDIH